MAQTPCKLVNDNKNVDIRSSADMVAGQIYVCGNVPMIVPSLIDYSEQIQGALICDGVWDIPQAAEAIFEGNVVYWDENGTPVTGDATSGAATKTSSGNIKLGVAVPVQPNGTDRTEATDSYVRVMLLPDAT